MIVLIGSEAAKVHHPELWDEPRDIDLVLSYDEFLKLIEDKNIPVVPSAKNKFVGEHEGRIIEFEIAFEGSSAASLLERVEGQPGNILDIEVLVPTMDWLLTIKASHRFKKKDRYFEKTLLDYHQMKTDLGYSIADSEWLEHREQETYTAKRPSLSTTKDDFFADSKLTYEYDHDSLHRAVVHLEQPAYLYYQKDGEEVLCDKSKWDACSYETKLFGVLEECYVLALERSQIPFGERVSPRDSFLMALQKVCTSITSGFFRAFAYENYFVISKMYSDEYMTRFEEGLKNGIVQKV